MNCQTSESSLNVVKHPGCSTEDMIEYNLLRKKKPDATLLHVRTNDYTKGSNIQLGSISRFWVQKIRQEKLLKFTKIFALYQVFMYNFLCQTVPIFLIYILVTKIIKKFWSRDVTDIWAFAHFESKIDKDF